MGFTKQSRSEMRWIFNALPWESIEGRLAMVTLTYGTTWPHDGQVVKRHLHAFRSRWTRRYGEGPIGVWALEFQERGAPHFHLYVGLPGAAEIAPDPIWDGELIWDWALEAWHEITGSDEAEHRARGVNVAKSSTQDKRIEGLKVGEYFWRESGKWRQKEVPEGFFRPGRFWGRWNLDPVEFETQITREEHVLIRRALVKLRDQKNGRRVQRPQGLDGVQVTGIDGIDVGTRLVAWARDLEGWERPGGESKGA